MWRDLKDLRDLCHIIGDGIRSNIWIQAGSSSYMAQTDFYTSHFFHLKNKIK